MNDTDPIVTDSEIDDMLSQPIVVERITPPSILSAINAIQKKLAATGMIKGQRNEHGKFDFRGIDQVYNVFGPLMAEHGIVPLCCYHDYKELPSHQGDEQYRMFCELALHLRSIVDGSEVVVNIGGEGKDYGAFATGKAESCAYKAAMIKTFAPPVAPGTEIDGDADPSGPGIGAPRTVHQEVSHRAAESKPPFVKREVVPPETNQGVWEGVAIEDMKIEDKKTKEGKPWQLYTVKFSNGKFGKCPGFKFVDWFGKTGKNDFYDVEWAFNPKFKSGFPDIISANPHKPIPA